MKGEGTDMVAVALWFECASHFAHCAGRLHQAARVIKFATYLRFDTNPSLWFETPVSSINSTL